MVFDGYQDFLLVITKAIEMALITQAIK